MKHLQNILSAIFVILCLVCCDTEDISGHTPKSTTTTTTTTTIPGAEKCENPVITGTDNFTSSTSVTISCSTTGAKIYYTIDGSAPTAASTEYTGAFTITKTTTIKAIAIKSGFNNSIYATKTLTKNQPQCAIPTITGTTPFDTNSSVTISCSTTGATIYYTTDGTNPTEGSTRYTTAFSIVTSCTVKAIAVKDNYNNSDVASKGFVKNGDVTENPGGVMIQGFTWSSAPRGSGFTVENPNPNWYKWYDVMIGRASDLQKFEYVWCPPPS